MIRLHHCHQARSMRTLWLLHELGLEHEVVLHGFGPELQQDAYRDLHPAGRVPVLEDDGLVLFESGAICEYLCETYPHQGLWREPGNPERPYWLQWLHFAETMGQHAANLTQQHIVIWDDADRSPVVMKLEAKRLARTVAVVDDALSEREFLLSDGFSAVDTAIGYALYVATHFVDLSDFPNVARYFNKLRGRPGFLAALPPDGATLIYTEPFYAAWPR